MIIAQYKLGVMYEFGEGVEKDYKKAFELYEKAANQGHSIAQNNLGLFYYHGRGVNKDKKKAIKLLSDSCNGGFQNGCRNFYAAINEKD